MSSARDRRSTCPVALNLYGQLRHRRLEDRLFVARQIERALKHRREPAPEGGVADRDAKRALAVASVQACSDAIGRVPSRAQYDAWHAALPEPSRWLTANSIRGAFSGSWARATEAAGAGGSGVAANVSLLALGRRFSRDELIDALRACAAEHPGVHLAFKTVYRPWAQRQARPDADAATPHHDPERTSTSVRRLPLAPDVFIRVFGSWSEALDAAGVTVERPPRPPRRETTDLPLQEPRWTREEMLGYLLMASALDPEGPRHLTRGRYEAVRQRWIAQKLQNGTARRHDRLVPSTSTIRATFGTWLTALDEAGLNVTEAATRRGSFHTDDDLDRALALARIASVKLTRHHYERWRATARPDHPWLPSAPTLEARLGDWLTIQARAAHLNATELLDAIDRAQPPAAEDRGSG